MAKQSVFQSQLADAEVLRELKDSGALNEAINETPSFSAAESPMGHVEAIESLASGKTILDEPSATEAIVMTQGYPALLVKNGDYEEPKLQVWQRRLNPHRDTIRSVIAGVGRVELSSPSMPWVGTCWLVDEHTLVTNRHVAEVFTEVRNGRIVITPGLTVNVDFREEHRSAARLEAEISKVSHIDNDVDLALMTLDRSAIDTLGIEPIPIANRHDESEFIGVCGYPARDSRNPPKDMARIFRNIYDVKRFAPGKVMDPRASDKVFTHNCTTLGGNSGSAVFDIATGAAVGLHFAGSALDSNRAVNLKWLREKLTRMSVQIQVPSGVPSDGSSSSADDTEAKQNFDDRDGYQPDFIGSGHMSVPMPGLNAMQATDVPKTRDGESVLNYRHFSVVMSKRRRLAYYAAANIDGASLRRPKRIKSFKVDRRIELDEQADNELYKHNPLDRGHLIRRLDPCWGSVSEADQANRDSMFFPNIAPQHKDLNQKVWLDLEEHILENTDDENARISVFVGCVFDEDDPPHKQTGIKVPMGFWKVVASSTRPSGGRSGRQRELQAQAFILFQSDLVKDRDLELIFGNVDGVKQITIEELERITGLDFHAALRDADTFGLTPDVREKVMTESFATGDSLSANAAHYKSIEKVDDIVGL